MSTPLTKFLREAMAAKGLTQAGTARLAEVSPSVYARILQSTLRLPSDVALRLAAVLELDARDLMALTSAHTLRRAPR